MLFLLSPAKSLDYDSPVDPTLPATEPRFIDQSARIIEVMRTKSPAELSALMDISAKLADLNARRNQAWSRHFTPDNSRQAVLAFNGDVYEGLQAASLKEGELQWAQDHMVILSGLYGALRPLDRLQPYRLEMGTRLPVGAAENLYQFWQATLADYLNERLAAQKTPVVVNLASNEYFKAVDTRRLKARVIDCVFQDEKNGQYKIISFYAKRARGLMARYAIEHRLEHPEKLQGFDLDGYAFHAAGSSEDRLVFRRREAH
ncbi:peroxide stress protein YaaA [Corticibacter populi]|uniref:UPF0246 protein D8I35_01075 n=1 Tax=Corticibacter populi TaxID=1550736 RepID=A0A3M6QXK2_9BURK|nr:peroxide stress protein YaaA [Corticibacter populi]RMX07760.1 peroxide stress protein YaaA [Corticibacter populi]RZS34982.1 hypothetical protein EV687_0034 [Corticibacter populi]